MFFPFISAIPDTMSLNTVTKGVGGATGQVSGAANNVTGNVNKSVDSARKGDVSSTVKHTKKQIDKPTKDLTGASVPDLPGGFPDEKDTKKNRKADEMPQVSMPNFSSWIQWFMDKFETTVKNFIARFLPKQRQEAIYKSAMSRPMATTFIICQLICCGVPLLVFMAGVFIFAAVAILLWAILSLLILGPILLITGCGGLLMWGWGWLFYSFVKWIDQNYLGGILTRYFLPISAAANEDEDEDESKSSDNADKGSGDGDNSEKKQ